MKLENLVTDGGFYGLSPKCYTLYSNTLDSGPAPIKTALKGIPCRNNVQLSDFRFAATDFSFSSKDLVQNFQFNRRKSEMQCVKRWKRAINAHYTKMQLQSDYISIRPLNIGGKYL